ncbi:MAG: hypothetical protein ACI4KF_11695 [Huintestinicola sp.]
MDKRIMKMMIPLIVSASVTGCSLSDISTGLTAPDPKFDCPYTADCTVTAIISPPSLHDDAGECEFVMEGQLTRYGGGFWKYSITAPETMKGIEFSLADTVLTCSLGELTFDTESTEIPQKSPVMALFSCLDSAAAAQTQLTAEKEEPPMWSFGGTAGGMNYTAFTDESGAPARITCDELRLSAEFENFTVSGEEMNITESGASNSGDS